MTTDRHVTEDMTPEEYAQIRRVMQGGLILFFTIAAGFAVRFTFVHAFTSFAATLAALFAAYCVAGPFDKLRKEGAPT